ncbi:MAG: cation-translocating P-type ATPase [Novosphingobium sp.]
MSVDPACGLSEAEAKRRLAAEGANALPGAGRRSFLTLALDVLSEPMLLLLLGAGAVYMMLGDIHDALILMAFAGLTVLIELVQEGRADRAIAALGELGAPQALVLRDGVRRRIPATEVVRGDILAIAEGDRITADGWLVDAQGLHADESILTGESVSVVKRSAASSEIGGELPLPGGDGLPAGFSGTLVVRGSGLLLATATGPATHMGKIGQSLASVDTSPPRLVAQTRGMVRWFALFGLAVSVLAGVLFGLLRGGWLDALLAGIALAMSMLPEELPVVLTLFLTMGALRLSRVRVLSRRGAAIESLGAATVLCTDKTGTLTLNRMAIAQLRLPDGQTFVPARDGNNDIPGQFVDLASLGILASLPQPFDPMEVAFHDLAQGACGQALMARQNNGWTLLRQYGLSPDLLAVTHVWSGPDGQRLGAVKGAPEAIAQLCRVDDAQRAELKATVKEMAAAGLRVLGVAEATWGDDALPDDPRGFPFVFRGLVGLADPLRADVPGAIAMLQAAGVRVVMITGDYPETAAAIAAEAGIRAGDVMTGPEIQELDDKALATRIRSVAVFARVMPEQKMRLVEALKSAGEIVAMTGDGVNDAPSLKAAHIGIAMGKRGTDVAREASAIVLLDDDFGAIPTALRLGRRIYDNLRKAIGFIVGVHIPIGGLALAPLLTGWPIILGPMHIALLEMVIDPICALAFEAEPDEPDVMERPPRDPDSALFPRSLVLWSVIQGLVALGAVVALAAWAQRLDPNAARSVIFAGLVMCVLVLVMANRSFVAGGGLRGLRGNGPLAFILLAVFAIFTLLLAAPAVAGLFRFTPIDGARLVPAVIAAVAAGAVLALLKPLFRKSLIH